jgi:hypothetical protein
MLRLSFCLCQTDDWINLVDYAYGSMREYIVDLHQRSMSQQLVCDVLNRIGASGRILCLSITPDQAFAFGCALGLGCRGVVKL